MTTFTRFNIAPSPDAHDEDDDESSLFSSSSGSSSAATWAMTFFESCSQSDMRKTVKSNEAVAASPTTE